MKRSRIHYESVSLRSTAVLLPFVLGLCLVVAAENHRETASRLYGLRDFVGAAAALEKHLKTEPGDHSARLLLGLCYQQAGDSRAAEAVIFEAVRRRPKDPQAHFYLARVQYLMSKFSQAKRNALASIELQGDQARAKHLVGLILEEQHQPEEALRYYQSAIQANSQGFAEVHLSAGVLLLKLNRAKEALAHLRAASRISPKLAEAHYRLARAYLDLEQPAEAEATLLETLKLADHQQARLLLGRIRSEALKPAEGARKPLSAPGPVRFRNVAEEAGLDFILENHPTPRKHLIETMAGGVAAFDYNNDGLIDIFFTNGAVIPSLEKETPKYFNGLYRNEGRMKFRDITAEARLAGMGYSMGAAAGDYDNDGNVDLFVAGVRRNILYRNTGRGRFEEVTAQAGIHSHFWSVAAGWFDYDKDGFLDLFVVNYVKWSPDFDEYCGDPSAQLRTYCHPKHFEGLANTLYRNRGDGTFEDVSKEAGIAAHIGKGMSVAFADYDQDGWMDVFVTNDTLPNFLFRNRGDGVFEEVGLEAGAALKDDGKAVSSMGVDFRDYDNDGRPDILFTALPRETFPVFRNQGKGYFRDMSYPSKIGLLSAPFGGWGIGLFDFNNDGWKDVFTANAHATDNIELFSHDKYRQRNSIFVSLGDGTFRDVSAEAGEDFNTARAHRGSAFADFNNDGRMDVVVSSLGEPPELWENTSPESIYWIALELEGVRGNRDGIGVEIQLVSESGRTQYNHVTTSVGYASSSSKRVHFGLGEDSVVRLVEVTWPSGIVQSLEKPPTNQILDIQEPSGQP